MNTPQQSATPTPRTDAAMAAWSPPVAVSVSFARTLETELAASRAEVEPYKKLNLELADLLKAERAQLAAKEQELAEAKAEVESLANETLDYHDLVGKLRQQLADRDATIAGLRELLVILRPKTLVVRRDVYHGNTLEPTSLTLKIDAALAQAPKAQPPTTEALAETVHALRKIAGLPDLQPDAGQARDGGAT